MQPLPPVIAHLERFCGPIARGWTTDPGGNQMPFQIVEMQGGPIAGTITYATLGLGKIPLGSRRSEKLVRHELVMLSRSNAKPGNLLPILQQVAMEAVQRNEALLRGEVIDPCRGRLFEGSTVTALYVSIPVYFPNEFASVEDDAGTVIFAWLIPITDEEVRLINENGWNVFEDKFEEQDPDLLDFGRTSAVS
jgi:hypothetical protein